MIQWTKKDLKEMFGDEITDQLAFLAGCRKYRLVNDKDIPDGWIISDESLKKFAELIVQECILTIHGGITLDGTTMRSMNHIMDIKEHFGIKTTEGTEDALASAKSKT